MVYQIILEGAGYECLPYTDPPIVTPTPTPIPECPAGTTLDVTVQKAFLFPIGTVLCLNSAILPTGIRETNKLNIDLPNTINANCSNGVGQTLAVLSSGTPVPPITTVCILTPL